MAYSRRSYKGAAVANALSGSTLAANATSINLASAMSGWSTASEPFFVVIDPGTAKEEKVCVIYNTSTSLTVVDPAVTSGWTASVNGRGADNTTDRSHDAGAVIYPVFTATEANQANELVSKYTTNGDIVVHGSSGPKTISTGGSGSNNKVLVADSTVSDGGVKWASITSDMITDGTIVNADISASAAIAMSKLATGALPTDITVASANIVNGTIVNADINASAAIELSKLATGALPTDITVASANIVNGTIALADLATAVANALVPVGTIAAYAGATAPTGWLMCDGTSTTGYTALSALVGSTTPDLKGRFLLGDNSTLELLATGGSTTIATTNLPAHSHAAGTLGADAVGDHTHASTATGYELGSSNWSPSGSASNWGYDVGTAAAGGHSHTISGSTAETGGAQAYYPPYAVVNYIIKHD